MSDLTKSNKTLLSALINYSYSYDKGFLPTEEGLLLF